MNNESILREEYKGYVITVGYDTNAESPQMGDVECLDAFIVYNHRQFYVKARIGSVNLDVSEVSEYFRIKNELKNVGLSETYREELGDELKGYFDYSSEFTVKPLFAYIHSGVSLSLTGGKCQFDESCSGYLFIKKQEEGGEDEEVLAKSVIDMWNDYLGGNVYDYEIHKETTCEHCGHTESEFVSDYGDIYGKPEDAMRMAKEEIDEF